MVAYCQTTREGCTPYPVWGKDNVMKVTKTIEAAKKAICAGVDPLDDFALLFN